MASLEEVEREARGCTRCPLAKSRTTVVFGEGDQHAALMVVGEGPGRDEDLQGRPFVGRSGRLLDRLLVEEVGVERADVYICNTIKCRPPGNRDPEPAELAACRPYLDTQLASVAPRVVLALGRFAAQSLLGTTQPIGALRGRSYRLSGAVLVPTFHPAAALRGGGEVTARMRADFVRAAQALQQSRPGRSGGEAALGPADGTKHAR